MVCSNPEVYTGTIPLSYYNRYVKIDLFNIYTVKWRNIRNIVAHSSTIVIYSVLVLIPIKVWWSFNIFLISQSQVSYKVHVRRWHNEKRSRERDTEVTSCIADAFTFHHAFKRGADKHRLAERLLQLYTLEFELQLGIRDCCSSSTNTEIIV